MSCLRSPLKSLCGLLAFNPAKQIPPTRQSDLCKRCRRLQFDNAFLDHGLSNEEEIELGAFAFNAIGKSPKCQIAVGTIQDLQGSQLCSFCQMILAAIREQYSTQGEILDPSGQYQVRWRYVRHKFIRNEEDDGRYTAYMEILSSGNSKLSEGCFNFKHEIKRKLVRSIIAPVSKPGSQKWLWSRELLEKVNSLQVKKWIQNCEQWHKDSCVELSTEQAAQLPSTSFRLIDVDDMCIVIPVMPCRYLALSYVWGRNGENSFLALKNNIASLAEPRGLNIVLNLLPPTISDAITITRDLGERYLWVDSLCIVQDDAESKEENIASMPLVYKGSTLTLVAGTGDSAISGLAGVQSGSRVRSQRILTLGRDKKLALVDDIELLLVKSPWDSRGWTYVVLRKSLIFGTKLTSSVL
jgi:Heterokaryon incompatibility protein (HET)